MDANKVKLLAEYGSFLKNNYLEQLAEENRQFLSRLNLHLIKVSHEFSVEDLLKMSITNLTALLTAFEEGKSSHETIDKILKLESEALPGIKSENIQSTDLISIYTAQKQSLFAFIPKFTKDPNIMMDLIQELEFTFLQATDFTLQTFVNERIKSATELTEGKVREEISSYYVDELKEANKCLEKLQEALLKRQETLVEKEIELTRSNQSLNHFANMASHDLKEPLRMVKMYVQLLARRYKGKLDTNADEFIGFAVDGVDRMEQLIQSILDYAKVNKLGIAVEFTSTKTALDRAKLNLTVAIEESKAEITNDALPMLKVNSIQLTQIFQNLLSNALKYCSPEIPTKIHIGVEKKGEGWIFCVTDNGIGINPEDLEKIFLPFQRLHSNREYEGIGLGLSFCLKTINQYGGNMWAESNTDKGTSFFFTIMEAQETHHAFQAPIS